MSRVLPILFNTDMVRAILGGRKTVTRRILKEQPPAGIKAKKADGIGFYWAFWEDGDKHWLKCPYDVGDILYVRETWCGWHLPYGWRYEYKATNPNGNKRPTGEEYDDEWEVRPWRPSIHMPKEAARIWLKVTDVRVERLQDMDCEDAMKEGIDPRCCINLNHTVVKFSKLWNSTIKKSDLALYGWDANPWVWVIEFERCEKLEEWR